MLNYNEGKPVLVDRFIKTLKAKIYNTINLSRHEQVCLSRLRFERYFSDHGRNISRNVAYLSIHVHDVMNVLYYEYWTDKQKYFYE